MHRIDSTRAGLLGALLLFFAPWGLAREPFPRSYRLALAPLDIHARLPALRMGKVPRPSAGERRLLAEVWKRKGLNVALPSAKTQPLEVEAMLLASDVHDAVTRKKYREQLDRLVVRARLAVKGAGNDRERGERLMRFLHRTTMSKGYAEHQSSFAAVFDTGKFNCVSSTALYYLVGTRLGLKLQPIAIAGGPFLPGHAALDLLDGDERVEVEPTNPNGFDWKAKTSRPGVVVLGFVPDRKKGLPVDGFAVAAMIYSNRGTGHARETPPRRLEAVRCYLAALALAPANETAVNNLLATLVNWGPPLCREKKFEEAVRVLTFGLAIDPRSAGLRNNHGVAWSQYVDHLLESGEDQNALQVLRRAAEAVPTDRDFQSPDQWFVRHGEKRVRDRGWEAGLAVVDRGLKALPAAERKKLLGWRGVLFRRWSQTLLAKKDVEGSLRVLTRAWALDPKGREVVEGIAYHTQEALAILEARGGPAAAVAHGKDLGKHFAAVKGKEISDMALAHAGRSVRKLVEAKRYREALVTARKYEPLLTKRAQRVELAAVVYDDWARRLAGEKKWKAALDKYAEGLKALPRQERLASNAVATVDQWAQPAIGRKAWDEAIRVYDTGLSYFPDNGHLKHNREYCRQMKQKG